MPATVGWRVAKVLPRGTVARFGFQTRLNMEVESALLSPGRRPLLNFAMGSPLRVKKNSTQLGLGAVRSPVLQKSKRPLSSEEKEKPTTAHTGSLGTPVRMKIGGVRHRAEELENDSRYTNQHCRTPSAVPEKKSMLQIKDFAVGKAIGKGKFGNVYLATAKAGAQGSESESVAVKVVSRTQLQQESANGTQALMNEVDILEALDHPNIVRFYGFCEDPRSFYLIMEHLPQGELFKAVRQQGGRVSESTCVRYIRDIAAAVAHMHHRAIVHRDIKPENVLLNALGALKLADFGTAARLHAPGSHQSVTAEALRYTRCGTPEYLSPEMVAGTGHGSATDMWAIGVMIYELLYGCTPFVAYEAAAIQPATPGSHRKPQLPSAQAPTPAQAHAARRICVNAVYRRIAAHDGDLAFPQPVGNKPPAQSSAQPPRAAVTPRKMDKQNNLIRSVFSPAKPAPHQRQPSQATSAPSPTRPSSPPGPSSDSDVSGATPRTPAASLSARAQRVPVQLDSPARTAATPTKTSRGLRDGGGRGQVRAAVPAQSDAVVSEEAKDVILQLLRPSPAERLAADTLLSCAWLCIH